MLGANWCGSMKTDGADAAHYVEVRFDARKGQVCFRHVGAITDVAAIEGLLAANCD